MIKINRIKMYRSSADPSLCYVHSTEAIKKDNKIDLGGEKHRVKEVLVAHKSKHWPGHMFYEIRLYGN